MDLLHHFFRGKKTEQWDREWWQGGWSEMLRPNDESLHLLQSEGKRFPSRGNSKYKSPTSVSPFLPWHPCMHPHTPEHLLTLFIPTFPGSWRWFLFRNSSGVQQGQDAKGSGSQPQPFWGSCLISTSQGQCEDEIYSLNLSHPLWSRSGSGLLFNSIKMPA